MAIDEIRDLRDLRVVLDLNIRSKEQKPKFRGFDISDNTDQFQEIYSPSEDRILAIVKDTETGKDVLIKCERYFAEFTREHDLLIDANAELDNLEQAVSGEATPVASRTQIERQHKVQDALNKTHSSLYHITRRLNLYDAQGILMKKVDGFNFIALEAGTSSLDAVLSRVYEGKGFLPRIYEEKIRSFIEANEEDWVDPEGANSRTNKKLKYSFCEKMLIGALKGKIEAGNLIHRDICRENILLFIEDNLDFDAKLTDFGIATLASRGNSQTGAAAIKLRGNYSTPDYQLKNQEMEELVNSTEKERKDFAKQLFEEGNNHKSDLYALGLVAYQSLTGRFPFKTLYATNLTVKARKLNEIKKFLESDLLPLPEGKEYMRKVFARCLGVEKAYNTPLEMLQEIIYEGKTESAIINSITKIYQPDSKTLLLDSDTVKGVQKKSNEILDSKLGQFVDIQEAVAAELRKYNRTMTKYIIERHGVIKKDLDNKTNDPLQRILKMRTQYTEELEELARLAEGIKGWV